MLTVVRFGRVVVLADGAVAGRTDGRMGNLIPHFSSTDALCGQKKIVSLLRTRSLSLSLSLSSSRPEVTDADVARMSLARGGQRGHIVLYAKKR